VNELHETLGHLVSCALSCGDTIGRSLTADSGLWKGVRIQRRRTPIDIYLSPSDGAGRLRTEFRITQHLADSLDPETVRDYQRSGDTYDEAAFRAAGEQYGSLGDNRISQAREAASDTELSSTIGFSRLDPPAEYVPPGETGAVFDGYRLNTRIHPYDGPMPVWKYDEVVAEFADADEAVLNAVTRELPELANESDRGLASLDSADVTTDSPGFQ
jgi:hypothetical protein